MPGPELIRTRSSAGAGLGVGGTGPTAHLGRNIGGVPGAPSLGSIVSGRVLGLELEPSGGSIHGGVPGLELIETRSCVGLGRNIGGGAPSVGSIVSDVPGLEFIRTRSAVELGRVNMFPNPAKNMWKMFKKHVLSMFSSG